jgi:hypothetical protein
MSERDAREAQRRRTLAALAELQAQLYRTPTEAEQRSAALALGREDVIPEPQEELPL